MTEEKLRNTIYAPLLEAWQIIKSANGLGPDDDAGWDAAVSAMDAWHGKYRGREYINHLERAMIEALDEIGKEGRCS